MKAKALRKYTSFRQQLMERNRAFNAEYEELAARPGQSLMELNRYMMAKYGINSLDTVYKIRRQAREQAEAVREDEP